ncbi:hypothetical protein T03_16832 [Trichinella britovi]|uniref:Uncharacterized protein n=1 Tax=Trichinella britovi TaxID=45882 RepID=A0A0V1C7G9_TRIBR|nr:hypothetical protein T03_16832 [Trichinella britovi]
MTWRHPANHLMRQRRWPSNCRMQCERKNGRHKARDAIGRRWEFIGNAEDHVTPFSVDTQLAVFSPRLSVAVIFLCALFVVFVDLVFARPESCQLCSNGCVTPTRMFRLSFTLNQHFK